MSQVVEDLLDRHNLLDRPKKVALIEGIPRPKYYWQRLKDSIKATVDAVKRSDNEDKVVSHGIHFRRDIQHEEPLLCGLYNKVTKEYLSLDSNYLYVYKSDGRRQDLVIPASTIERLLHASLVNLYVAWRPARQELYLMNVDFDIISESSTGYNIVSVAYNENNGEIVTSGSGVVSMWSFRYGARHLIPRASTTHSLSEEDHFSLLVMEDTAQPNQKLFAVCQTSVAVFHVGDCVMTSYQHDLHPRPITAAAFFNPMKYLLTGAKDGCIKVWTDEFLLQHVFIGHTGHVTVMAAYPHGTYFLSAGADRTLRVWSLDLKDQVDVKQTEEPIQGIGTVIGEDCFFSYSGEVMKLWRLNHLHCEHTTIGYRVDDVKHSSHPMFPVRSVLRCGDSSVRLVCPKSGDVITTVIMPVQRHVIDMAYATELHAIFCVFGNGDLIKAETSTNPCRVVGEWPCRDQKKAATCLLVYEYIVNMWGAETRTKVPATRDDQRGQRHHNKTLLLAGRRDGFICVYDMNTGEVNFEIEAHERKGVKKIVANAKFDQLISAGADNIIKIWRVYPYAQESLAPLMSFFCAHQPVHMVTLKTRLCVAFEDHGTATYNVIVHDLENKDRFDHEPSNDHTDSITGLACCHRLRVFASSSYDGTARVWNQDNQLLRVLTLNATPYSIGFCSQKADLVLGIGNHLHFIDHKKFLPRELLFRMVCMRFPTQHDETALPWDEALIEPLSKMDIRRLKTARAAFRFETFGDLMTEEEAQEVLGEERAKEKAFSLLGAREQELMMIRDGKLQSKHKRRPTKQTKNEAFDKYLKIFYDRPKVELPDENKTIEMQMKMMLEGPPKPFKEEYVPEFTTGFFPPPHTAVKPKPEPHKPLEPPYRPPPDGFIPNSVLTRLLWPEKGKMKKSEYRPPMMSEEQMARIAKMNKEKDMEAEKAAELADLAETAEIPASAKSAETSGISVEIDLDDEELEAMAKASEAASEESKKAPRRSSSSFEDRAMILDYGDDDEDRIPEADRDDEYSGEVSLPPLHIEEKKKSDTGSDPSSFMMKLKSAMEKPPSPKPEPEPEVELKTEPTQISVAASARTESSTPKPRELKPVKPIKKFVSKGPAPQPRLSTPPPKVPMKVEPEPVRREATPPPKEQLPEFITRNKGEEWFEKYFPNCNEHTLPKPWTVDAFTTMLLRVLRIAEFPHKVGVCRALRVLHVQEGIPNTMIVRTAVLGVLNSAQSPPSCQNEHEKAFIEASLYLIVALQLYDKVTYSTLMVMYLEGDTEIRSQTKDLLQSLGLRDLRGVLYQELDKWEIWSIDDKNPRKAITAMADNWLDKWMTAFKMHIQDVIDKLKRGEGVQGRVGSKAAPKTSSKGILKKEDPAAAKSVTVTFEAPPDQSTIDNATYIEAINYFAEMERARLMQDKLKGRKEPAQEETQTGPKNTVLVLPKINKKTCLVRLGETHCSTCHPHRETSLHVDYRKMARTSRGLPPMPGELRGFAPAIHLPMKSIDPNPWSSQYSPLSEPMFVTLKLAPKYFIPEHSQIRRTAEVA